MTEQGPRVAFFPDSFHEVNGVAHTSRQFEAFAGRRGLPFLCVRAGQRSESLEINGELWSLELPRSPISIPLEKDLSFDPAYARHLPTIMDALERFEPDLIHITGPSEMGILGAALARHYNLPLAASWHTNLHEYAARRSHRLLRLLPHDYSEATGKTIEDLALVIATDFYSSAHLLFAPSPDLCQMLERETGRPCHLMQRGVDSVLFHPQRRRQRENDRDFILGYVGRLSIEKNVALLTTVQRELEQRIHRSFRFLIVGGGVEEENLRQHLPRAQFAGVLKGEALAEAYANMDLFIFPSHTDTFGNVVLEALASGVPGIVTPDGGPSTIIRDGVTGRIAPDVEFSKVIADIIEKPMLHEQMRTAARSHAQTASWDSIFEGVYSAYKYLGCIPQIAWVH
ncbi:glycosyltransferase [Telmatobacter sp. DSM 110680]|uniref:Glycosyltransferase n=1 Tax=Telmatobacter sp. DSM 110680 TaxID=3036704 RepID=A0AAU7DID7_9BACT